MLGGKENVLLLDIQGKQIIQINWFTCYSIEISLLNCIYAGLEISQKKICGGECDNCKF